MRPCERKRCVCVRVCVYVFVYSVGGDGRLTPSNPHAHPYQQPPHHEKQSLAEQLKRTRDDEEAQYLSQKMQAVIARLYCMTGQSKVQGACHSMCLVSMPVSVYTRRATKHPPQPKPSHSHNTQIQPSTPRRPRLPQAANLRLLLQLQPLQAPTRRLRRR